MNSDVTELVFLLGRICSMPGLEAETRGGFNSLIEKQKEKAGTAYVATVL